MDRGKDGAEAGVDKQAEKEARTPGRFAHAGPTLPRGRGSNGGSDSENGVVPTFYCGAEARKVGEGRCGKPCLPGEGRQQKLGGGRVRPGAR